MTAARRFLISGRVQGVYFRESTRRMAENLGLTGYANNLSDGSVEVLACGEDEAIQRLEHWLNHGPPMSKVDRVTAISVDVRPVKDFTTGWG